MKGNHKKYIGDPTKNYQKYTTKAWVHWKAKAKAEGEGNILFRLNEKAKGKWEMAKKKYINK